MESGITQIIPNTNGIIKGKKFASNTQISMISKVI